VRPPLALMANGFKEQQAAAAVTDLSQLPAEQQLPHIVQLLSNSTLVSGRGLSGGGTAV